MKRLIFLLLILIVENIFSNPVDSVKAKTIALNFYHSLIRNKVSLKKIDVSIYKGQNTYYTFVFQNNDWIVIAADDAVEPVLAFSTEGNYSNNPFPAYIDWMQGYDVWINYIKENKTSNSKTISLWEKLYNNNIISNRSSGISPLLSTNWGQSFPNDDLSKTIPAYNFYVPNNSNCPTQHCEAGCVAVAMAQILKYWNSPICPQFDWSNMPNELNFNNSNYETQRNAIAFLIAQCGAKTNMNYCSVNCYSDSHLSEALLAFINDFHFQNAIDLWMSEFSNHQWRKKIRDELDLLHPIFYRGEGNHGGHAWVCDGYQSVFSGYLYHFNWGWNGEGNGYFKINDDNPIVTVNGVLLTLQHNQGMIVNLYPNSCNTNINISNTVNSNNFYSSNYPYIKWFSLPQSYNYMFPLSIILQRPLSSEIIVENGETRLKYNDITAGEIYANNVTIPDKINVNLRAYNEIVLTNFSTEDGAEFTAEIIPCPNSNNCDFDDLNKSFIASRFFYNDTLIKNENVKNQDVKIFPNPTTGKLYFEIKNYNNSRVSVTIFNVFGENILNTNLNRDNKTLDLMLFPSGVYFVEVHYNNKIFMSKIIKTK